MLVAKDLLKKIPQPRAIDILSRYQQERSFKSMISPDTTPIELINQLYQQKQWQELVTFLCHCLPAVESIWWGYSCISFITEAAAATLPEHQKNALDVVYRWLQEPVEANRRLAELAVTRTELDNACGWLAQAVFWSGGSITPLNGPESPAPPYLYSHAVAGAICLAAVLPDGKEGEKHYQQCIACGIDIADGGDGRKK